jgi:TolA-binding protein
MVLCCIALVAILSTGDEHLTASEELYRQATMLYDAQRYQEALERFQEIRVGQPHSRIGCESTYWSAECMYSLGRYAEAVSILRDPGCEGVWDRGRALNRLGWSLFKLGDFREAARAFETAADLLTGDRRLRALYMAAESSLETGEAAEARALYRRVADEFPGTGEAGQAQFMIAESLYKQGMYGDAAQAYERFIDSYPDHDYTDDAVYGLAWARFKQGRREDAATEFNRLAAKWPRSPLASEALYRLGEARYWAERYQEAIDSFSKVDPGSDFAAAALYWTGWARFRLGEYLPAAAAFTAVRTEHPYSDLCPDAQFRAGECYLLAGDLHEACNAYRIVEDFYGESDVLDDALYGLTQCHKSLGDRDAVDRYRGRILAMKDSPFRAEVLFDRATEDFNEQRFRTAASGFLQLAREHPDHPIAAKAQLRGGMSLFKADDFEAARAAFLRVQTLWPKTPEAREALYRAAWSLFSEGRFVQAEVEFLAVSRDTASPWRCDALYRSGDCLYNRGLYRDAAARYEQVVACEGASRSLLASAHNSLAWCHLESGERLEAATAFSLVMREFPGTAPWEDSAFKLAELRREMGDTSAAYEAFVQIAENEFGALRGNAAHELVLLEMQRGKHREALAWAERLTGSPDPALRDEGERLKIELLVILGRRGEARQLCREVLATERPEEMVRTAHYWLGRIAWDEQDWGTAARSFASAAQSEVGAAEDYLWWAKSLVMSGDDAAAARAAEEAVARAVDAAERRMIPLEMGRVYRDAGKSDEAVKEFLKVAILHPLTQEARQALLLTAETYEQTGDTQKARTTLEELIGNQPQSAEAGEARQRLKHLGP